MIYHRKTNKHCATAEASRVRQRKNMLKQYAGVNRKYGEINNAFWRGGGKQVIVVRAKLHSYKKREGSRLLNRVYCNNVTILERYNFKRVGIYVILTMCTYIFLYMSFLFEYTMKYIYIYVGYIICHIIFTLVFYSFGYCLDHEKAAVTKPQPPFFMSRFPN